MLVVGFLFSVASPEILLAEHEPEHTFLDAPQTQTNQPTSQALTGLSGSIKGNCYWGVGIIALDMTCITGIIARVLNVVLSVVGYLSAAFANLFSYTLGLSITDSSYNGIPAVENGWRITRDVVNIFFIFILLFIAIATILQIEGYGAKRLLANLIIIALLVNFSLLAAQAIIYVTNSLAAQFYNSINAPPSPFLQNLNTPFSKDLAGAIQAGLQEQKIFLAIPAGTNDTTINIALIEIMASGILLIVFASFIFLMGAFFFVARLAALWLLMILAPFGFVFLILPVTKSYALQWWRALQNQAIFAPAFLFFFYITLGIIQSPLIKNISLSAQTPSGSLASPESTFQLILVLIIQHVIILILLGASLYIAKSLSIYGANAAIGAVQGAGKWFKGYAGRTGWRAAGLAAAPLGATTGAMARGLQAAMGRIPLIGRTRLGAFLGRGAAAPLSAATRTFAGVQAQRRKTFDDQAKAFTNLPPNQLGRVLATAPPGLQRAILDKVKDKRRTLTLKAMENKVTGDSDIVRLGRNMAPFGMEKDVAKATNSPAIAMKILHPELKAPRKEIKDIPAEEWNEDEKKYQKAQNEYMDTLNDKEIAQLEPNEIENNATVQASIFQTFNPRRFNALMKNREQLDAVVTMIKKLTRDYKGDKSKFAHLKDMVKRDLDADLDQVMKPGKEGATPPMAVNLIMGAEGTRLRVGGQAVLTIPAAEVGEAEEGETEGTT